MKLPKFHYPLILLSVLIVAISCSERRKAPTDTPAKMELSSKDTSAVRSQCDAFMQLLKDKNYDEALSNLYYIDSLKQLIPLPKDLQNNFMNVLNTFPVLEYHFSGMIFKDEMDNQVKYTIEFFEKAVGDDRPNTTSMYFRPVRVKGDWYLTVYDTASNRAPASEIK